MYGSTKVRAVSGFSASDYLRSTVAMVGIGTRGFGNVTMFRLKSLPATTQIVRRNINGNAGWQQIFVPATASQPPSIVGYFGTGSAFIAGPHLWLTPDAVGRVHVVATRITTVPGTLDSFINATQASSVAISAYAQPSNLNNGWVGYESVSNLPAPAFEWIADLDFYDVPSSAQIVAYMQAARELGDLPPGFPSSVEMRHSLRDTFGAATPLVDGQVAPATFADTKTGAAAYALQRFGSPVLREYPVTDQGVNYGVTGCSAASYLRSAETSGLGAVAGPFVAVFHMRCEAATLASSRQVLLARSNDTQGWWLYASQNYLGLVLCENTAGIYKQALFYSSGDFGRDLYVTVEYTGTSARIYVDGALGGSVEMSGTNTLVPHAGNLTVGNLETGAFPAPQCTFYGLTGKNTTTTAAVIAQHVKDCRRAGRLLAFPGATRLYDFTQDVLDAGGPAVGLPASFAQRIGGGESLTPTGPGAQVTRRAERAFAFEATPVASGFVPNAAGTYYDSTASGHDGGAAAGKSIALLFSINSQLVNKTRELLSIGRVAQPAVDSVMGIRASGAMATLQALWYTGTGWANTGLIAVNPGDVGRLMLLVTQFDKNAGRARLWWKRVEVGAPGVTMTAFAPGTNNLLRLGHLTPASVNPSPFAEEVTFFGAMTFDGVWSPAEINVLYDGVAAEDDLVALPASRVGHHWSFKKSIGTSGALPSTVADLAGASPLTRVGAPSFRSHYAHGPLW